MAIGNKDFELFQEEFLKYQNLLGLNGYQVYFRYESLGNDTRASIDLNQIDMVATVWLNSTLPEKDKPCRSVQQSAKHEAIHLLLGRLDHRGRYRYTSEHEIDEAIEELVFRLEKVIP